MFEYPIARAYNEDKVAVLYKGDNESLAMILEVDKAVIAIANEDLEFTGEWTNEVECISWSLVVSGNKVSIVSDVLAYNESILD